LVVFFQAEDGIRDDLVTGVQTCALPISAETRTRCRFGGFKLRCGGLEAASFPTAEQIAFVLARCSDSAGEVPIKFTAGLHHPVQIGRASCREKVEEWMGVERVKKQHMSR